MTRQVRRMAALERICGRSCAEFAALAQALAKAQ